MACADADGNVELFMQAGFMRYGEERILFRAADDGAAGAVDRRTSAATRGIRPTSGLDAIALARLYGQATPPPVARLEAIRLADWERQGPHWRVPRSSLTPILRFADVEGFVQAAPDGGRDGTLLDAFLQIGVAKEDQPHYLKVVARPEADVTDLIDFGLGVIAARTEPWRRPSAAIAASSPRSAPTNRRSTAVSRRPASTSIAKVTLLMKETLVRVAEPALVPAGVR